MKQLVLQNNMLFKSLGSDDTSLNVFLMGIRQGSVRI